MRALPLRALYGLSVTRSCCHMPLSVVSGDCHRRAPTVCFLPAGLRSSDMSAAHTSFGNQTARRHLTASACLLGKKKIQKKPDRVDESVISQLLDVEQLKTALNQHLDSFRSQLMTKFSIRTAAGSIESLSVRFDGDKYPIDELAQVVRKSPSLIVVNCSAFPEVAGDVMNVLRSSSMGLNPQQEGTTIYVQLPKVTKDHRENLAKGVKSSFIQCRDVLKKIQNSNIKTIKDMPNTSEDTVHEVESQIVLLTDQYVASADKLTKAKTEELLG